MKSERELGVIHRQVPVGPEVGVDFLLGWWETTEEFEAGEWCDLRYSFEMLSGSETDVKHTMRMGSAR